MLRSNFCLLHDLEADYQYELNECPLDQVSPIPSANTVLAGS
jgi:hypothetical protein